MSPRMGGYVPADHKTRHQDGGRDEISIASLSGTPAALTTHAALTATHGVSGTIADADDLTAHKASITDHLAEMLAVLIKGENIVFVPMTGWDETKVGSGVILQGPVSHTLGTGITASSTAICVLNRMRAFGDSTSDPSYMTWNKKLYFIFNIGRDNSDAQAIARVQLKNASTEGALADKGLGIRLDNLALVGESYNTALGEVTLMTLSTAVNYQIVIIHYPLSKVEWYVNGVLKGTQSTATKIPAGGSYASLVTSIINGVTGGTSVYLHVGQPKIWQAR